MAAVSRESLSSLSFGDLLTVQRSVGTKTFNALWKGDSSKTTNKRKDRGDERASAESDADESDEDASDVQQDDDEMSEDEELPQSKRPKTASEHKPLHRKRENKNRPMEISSKRPVSRRRTVVETTKKASRDPRFENYAGKLNQDLFQRSYGFLDEYEDAEIKQLRQELQKEKNARRRSEIERTLTRMISRKKMNEEKSKRQSIKREWRKAETELVKQGKQPFYLKKSGLKKIELVEKYKDMVSKGKDLDKILEKRRKKNASKERRGVPATRRNREEE